jgi:hypothetical protein
MTPFVVPGVSIFDFGYCHGNASAQRQPHSLHGGSPHFLRALESVPQLASHARRQATRRPAHEVLAKGSAGAVCDPVIAQNHQSPGVGREHPLQPAVHAAGGDEHEPPKHAKVLVVRSHPLLQ